MMISVLVILAAGTAIVGLEEEEEGEEDTVEETVTAEEGAVEGMEEGMNTVVTTVTAEEETVTAEEEGGTSTAGTTVPAVMIATVDLREEEGTTTAARRGGEIPGPLRPGGSVALVLRGMSTVCLLLGIGELVIRGGARGREGSERRLNSRKEAEPRRRLPFFPLPYLVHPQIHQSSSP